MEHDLIQRALWDQMPGLTATANKFPYQRKSRLLAIDLWAQLLRAWFHAYSCVTCWMLIACGLDRLEPTVNGFWPDDYSTIASSLDLHLSARSATTLTLLRKHAPSSVYTDFIWANILRSHIKRHVNLGAQTRFCGSRYSPGKLKVSLDDSHRRCLTGLCC